MDDSRTYGLWFAAGERTQGEERTPNPRRSRTRRSGSHRKAQREAKEAAAQCVVSSLEGD
jgi:hypothetical protein